MIKLGLICPCFNEEEILYHSFEKLKNLLESLIEKKKLSSDSFILFVNDGSKDKTWEIITQIHSQCKNFKGLDLVCNVGHQNAIMAGMMTAKNRCDAVITMDVDLQDDLNCIEQMIEHFNNGYDVVYGVKVSRKGDSFLKKATAISFYKIQHFMGINAIYNHADFRLLSNEVLNRLAQYPEKNLYLRALIPLIGSKIIKINDIISKREAGISKYTLQKMLKLAIDGITSFSIRPISMIVCLGFFCLLICSLILLHTLYTYIAGYTIPGWTSLMVSIWFLFGILLLSLGIIGIYIGKIFIEVKNRPLYNISKTLWN